MIVEQVSGSAWAECPNGVESARIYTHVRHEGVGLCLTGFDQFLDMSNLGSEITELQCLCCIGRMLALHGSDQQRVVFCRNEKHRVLTAVLIFAEDFHGPAKHDFAYLGA